MLKINHLGHEVNVKVDLKIDINGVIRSAHEHIYNPNPATKNIMLVRLITHIYTLGKRCPSARV